MPSNGFKYDVAFSFLAQDERVAARINDLIVGRLVTFLYSKRQEQLAGADGEELFGKVFGSEARLVVVLYREGWGQTPWTRIEETAIRNRAHDQGYDFTLFVMLDKSAALPRWMPKPRLWYGLERFGDQGAVSVIELRVQEAGGDTRAETFEERAARLKRETDAEASRKQFLASDAGVGAAKTELMALHQNLTARVEEAKAAGFKAGIEVKHSDASLTCGQLGLGVDWHLAYSNSLNDSRLEVTLWDGPPPGLGDTFPFSKPKQRARRTFHFDRDHGQLGWRESNEPRFLTTQQLAEQCVTYLLEKVHEDEHSARR